MANPNDKAQKNISGKFYVDNSCVGCGQCLSIASDCFAEDPDAGGIYVKQQPTSAASIAACQEAINSCPVEAIGADGE